MVFDSSVLKRVHILCESVLKRVYNLVRDCPNDIQGNACMIDLICLMKFFLLQCTKAMTDMTLL